MTTEETKLDTFESGLPNEKHNALAVKFNPYAESVHGLIDKANAITVRDATDVESMKAARTVRLALRKQRVEMEHMRKDMKSDALREGKAIDGMANILKYLIEPVEAALQEKEDFVKRAEAERIAALVEDRTGQLNALDVDCQHFDLGAMNEEAFTSLLASSRAGYEAKKAAEKAELERIEAEREAAAEQARKDAEERARIEAENAKLKAEAEKREAEAQAERENIEAAAEAERAKAEAERKSAEAKAKAEREKIEAAQRKAEAEAEELRKAEQERILAAERAEAERVAAELKAEQARKQAPDADKLAALVAAICALSVPSVSSDVALECVADVRTALNGVVKTLRASIAEMSKEK